MEDDPPILNITAGLATLKRCDTVLAKGSHFNQMTVQKFILVFLGSLGEIGGPADVTIVSMGDQAHSNRP